VFTDMSLIHEIYKPQLAILPIGDLFTMSPREAAVACRLLKAEKVVPAHFGTFPPLTGTPAQLRDLLREPGSPEIWELQPGVPVRW